MLLGQEWTYFVIDSADINEVDLEIIELPLKVL
jgi:hypothetical protein